MDSKIGQNIDKKDIASTVMECKSHEVSSATNNGNQTPSTATIVPPPPPVSRTEYRGHTVYTDCEPGETARARTVYTPVRYVKNQPGRTDGEEEYEMERDLRYADEEYRGGRQEYRYPENEGGPRTCVDRRERQYPSYIHSDRNELCDVPYRYADMREYRQQGGDRYAPRYWEGTRRNYQTRNGGYSFSTPHVNGGNVKFAKNGIDIGFYHKVSGRTLEMMEKTKNKYISIAELAHLMKFTEKCDNTSLNWSSIECMKGGKTCYKMSLSITIHSAKDGDTGFEDQTIDLLHDVCAYGNLPNLKVFVGHVYRQLKDWDITPELTYFSHSLEPRGEVTSINLMIERVQKLITILERIMPENELRF